MRLFTAILFDEKSKASLYDTVLRLRTNASGGSFTAKENLHLTVNFIGETKRLEEVKHAMQRAVEKAGAESFDLTLQGFDRFARREGDIYWVGVLREEVLWRIQRELVRELKEEGFFDMDDREYKPHLTLGRRVRVNPGFDSRQFETTIQPLKIAVTGLSLMKSERVEGKLTYTEVYRIKLD